MWLLERYLETVSLGSWFESLFHYLQLLFDSYHLTFGYQYRYHGSFEKHF